MTAEKNPADLLHAIMRQSPRASEKEVFDAFLASVEDDSRYLPALARYWFASNYKRVEVVESSPHSIAILRRENRAKRMRITDETIERERAAVSVIRAVLMDFVLSNGKQLRRATFGDCAREGGWLQAIAKQGKAHEIVGKKLTETDLHNLQTRQRKAA